MKPFFYIQNRRKSEKICSVRGCLTLICFAKLFSAPWRHHRRLCIYIFRSVCKYRVFTIPRSVGKTTVVKGQGITQCFSTGGPQVVPEGSASRIHSTFLFFILRCRSFKLFATFLLPQWSKRVTENSIPSVYVLVSLLAFCLIKIYEVVWRRGGCPRYQKGWETLG
jgi:hypothetical protein